MKLIRLNTLITNILSIDNIINGEYEIWDTDFNQMLVNEISLEQMLKML